MKYLIISVLFGIYISSVTINTDIYHECEDLMLPESCGTIFRDEVKDFKNNFYSMHSIDKRFHFVNPDFSVKLAEENDKSFLTIYCNGYDFDDDRGTFILSNPINCLIPFKDGDIFIQKHEIIEK